MTNRRELADRLEAAECGSRELDREIMALSYFWDRRHIGATCWDDGPNGEPFEDDDGKMHPATCCPGAKHLDWVWVDPKTDRWVTTAKDGFEFTTSLDAALALAERVYPDGWIDLWIRNGTATAHQCFEGNKAFRSEPHKRPAIAVCAAILRARLDDEGKGLPKTPEGPIA